MSPRRTPSPLAERSDGDDYVRIFKALSEPLRVQMISLFDADGSCACTSRIRGIRSWAIRSTGRMSSVTSRSSKPAGRCLSPNACSFRGTPCLRIAAEFTTETTFLGAHTVPAEYAHDADAYVDLVCGEMLAAAAPHARWIDVFCERGAFDAGQTRRILTAGRNAGLGVRLHGNQLGPGPGVALAVEFGAASVDHCTHLSDADVDALAGTVHSDGSGTRTVATLLPGAEFSTRSPYPDARRLLDAGVGVALATDCNPGSSYTSSMPFCIALAVREMGMTPAEAVAAATAGGAAALRRDDLGRLAPGARADLMILDAPSHLHLAYRPGVPLVRQVLRNGVPR